ncbi:MAG: hypothetical protein MMC33_002248 [Icmadophila ericetorum]|nr:hypothetical protein [Icmadophila ericetorum]
MSFLLLTRCPRVLLATRSRVLPSVGRPYLKAFDGVKSSTRPLTSFSTPIAKLHYPEKLAVYHVGVTKTVFLGCLKLTTIFLFTYTCVFVAPKIYQDVGQPQWLGAAVIAAGAVPLLFVAYITSPFVNFIRIKLPVFARRSQEQLLRWSKDIPLDTEIEIATIRLNGLVRYSRLRLKDLKEESGRFGMANLKKVTSDADHSPKRPWWKGRELKVFLIGSAKGSRRSLSNSVVWERAFERIRNNENARKESH